MKILCIGDSLGLPREGCSYEETWFSQLVGKYPQHTFFSHFEGGRLIESALNDYNMYYRYYNTDVVILQQGIVYCSPRSVNDKKAINLVIRKLFTVFGLTKLYWKIVKSHPRRPDCVYTKIESFETKYGELVKSILSTENKAIIAIKIGHSTEALVEKSSKYFNSNVDRYNAIIDKIANDNKGRMIVISPLDKVEDDMFLDGYHCSAKGMKMVYEDVLSSLKMVSNCF